jgi:hypothetical protein
VTRSGLSNVVHYLNDLLLAGEVDIFECKLLMELVV